MKAETAGPDWRDAGAYAALLAADRSLFAWEWLRRDPEYRSAAFEALSERAHMFGLVGFEDPDARVPRARPLWRSFDHPFVLRVERARPPSVADPFDLSTAAAAATLLTGTDGEHLLLSDGLRAIRLDGPAGAFSDGPAPLRYRIEGLAAAQAPLVTLRRFVAFGLSGRFARTLHPGEAMASRWILMLRAWDALSVGADQRSIAGELLSSSAKEPRWRSREPSVRSRSQRLVRCARAFANGGYRSLLV